MRAVSIATLPIVSKATLAPTIRVNQIGGDKFEPAWLEPLNTAAYYSALGAARLYGKCVTPGLDNVLVASPHLAHLYIYAGTYQGVTATLTFPTPITVAFLGAQGHSKYGAKLTHFDPAGTIAFSSEDTTITIHWIVFAARPVPEGPFLDGVLLDPGDHPSLAWGKKVGANAEICAYAANMFATEAPSQLTYPRWGSTLLITGLTSLEDPDGLDFTGTIDFKYTVRAVTFGLFECLPRTGGYGSGVMPYIWRINGGTEVVFRTADSDRSIAALAVCEI